ncbi:MAG: class I SAM-dependent methyltransferase [Acidimicrobiales bacterium]
MNSAPRAVRALSFGGISEDYDRFRPAPPVAALDWLLPEVARTVADVCAGTGAFTRVAAGRVDRVVAVDLDPRMLAVLGARSTASVLCASGDALPFADRALDAVVVSSGWHWLDPARAVPEIARAVRAGGTLGVVWNGPDRTSEWVADLFDRRRSADDLPAQSRRMLSIPDGQPFSAPDRRVIRWSIPRTRSELLGLVGTYSRVITSGADERRAELRRAEALIERLPAAPGLDRIDLPMRAFCWRAVRTGG